MMPEERIRIRVPDGLADAAAGHPAASDRATAAGGELPLVLAGPQLLAGERPGDE